MLLHGRPRLTEDIDVALGVDPSHLPVVREVCRALNLDPLPEHIENFVADTNVFPVHDAESSIRVDFIFSTTPYERQAIERAVVVELAAIWFLSPRQRTWLFTSCLRAEHATLRMWRR